MTATVLTNLRQAISSSDFATAQVLWNEFVRATLRQISSGACTAERLAEARDLVDWARQQALCCRAQTQDLLNTVHVARQYEGSPAPPRTISGLL